MFLIHFLKDFEPHPVVDAAVLNRVEHLLGVFLALERVLVFNHDLHQVEQGLLHVGLDEAEVFVTLVLQNLGEESHIMLFLDVSLHRIDDRGGPLND